MVSNFVHFYHCEDVARGYNEGRIYALEYRYAGDEKMNFNEDKLLLALDKGINDMENGRELPLDDAFEMVDRLIKYKGFQAKVHFDDEDNLYVGEVIDILDSVNFPGTTMDEAERVFPKSIDNYLKLRNELKGR